MVTVTIGIVMAKWWCLLEWLTWDLWLLIVMTMMMTAMASAKLTSTFVDVPNKISILEDQRKYWPLKTKVSNWRWRWWWYLWQSLSAILYQNQTCITERVREDQYCLAWQAKHSWTSTSPSINGSTSHNCTLIPNWQLMFWRKKKFEAFNDFRGRDGKQ